MFAPWWLWREAGRCGAGDYLAATATYDLFKLKLLPEMRRVFEEELHWGRFLASERVLLSNDGKTRIILRSANAPGGLESATVKAAILDECGQDSFRLESWEAVQRRLSLSQGRCLLTTTPYNLGWLKSQIADRWRSGDPDYDLINFPSIQNPAFPRAEYERARRTLPKWKWDLFYNGIFTRPAGLIYEDYEDEAMAIEPIPLPAEWPRYVGIDFGAVNTALVWIAEDTARKAYYIYRESLEGGLSTAQHAAKALMNATSERVAGWYGGSKSETQQRMDWKAAGIQTHAPPVSDVEAGIDRVIELFKTKRLYVFKTCSGMRDELGTYSREVDDAGQPTEKIRDKETFHRLDALRYVIAGCTRGSDRSLVGFA
uniref:Putative terminase n=3 Tax=viral metagenome TaxID=1070528 RepID=A0A6M3KSU9_9ZZZZ